MRRFGLLLAPLAALSACSPPPRAVSFFHAHPEETGKVLVDCAAGTHRGVECDNAQAAEALIKSDARLKLYRKSF